jgi:VanZ family protein
LKEKVTIAVIWSFGMAYALYSPGSNVPDIPKFYGSDKLIHFGMFTGMSLLWNRVILEQARQKIKPKTKFFTNYLVLWILIAILSEYIQMFVPDRSFDYMDILTNITGVITGTGIFVYLNKRGSSFV